MSTVAQLDSGFDWKSIVYFIIFHCVAVACFFVPMSWYHIAIGIGMYVIRMFYISTGYHRFFTHRTYDAPYWYQIVIAVLGSTAVQRGPLWWSAVHALHHANPDNTHDNRTADPHKPEPFWEGHIIWILRKTHNTMPIPKKYQDKKLLLLIDKYHIVFPIALGVISFLFGGLPLLASMIISTLFLYHATWSVNSFAHTFGSQPYQNHDNARNLWWVAILTLGEGWHNYHHHRPRDSRFGWFDPGYWGLVFLEKIGIISNLNRYSLS